MLVKELDIGYENLHGECELIFPENVNVERIIVEITGSETVVKLLKSAHGRYPYAGRGYKQTVSRPCSAGVLGTFHLYTTMDKSFSLEELELYETIVLVDTMILIALVGVLTKIGEDIK